MGLIKLNEAAKLIGVNRQTLINWNKDGYLRFHYIGRGKKSPALIDENTINAISDTAQEIEYAKSALQKELLAINTEYKKERTILSDIRREVFLVKKVGHSPFVKEFFQKIPFMLYSTGIINKRDWDIMRRIVAGEDIGFIANEYNLSRTTVILAFYRGCRKAEMLPKITELSDTVNELRKTLREKDELLREFSKKHDVRTIELYATPLNKIGFTQRTLNCLKAAEIETIGDLVEWRKIDLLKFRNFGKKSLQELNDFLESKNLKLKD